MSTRSAPDSGTAAGDAGLVVVGPAPPLRGGIAAHTARLVESCLALGVPASALSWSRLYPRLGFPGRAQRTGLERPAWCNEALDSLDPRSWRRVGARLEAGRETVVLQWWHPFFAPALSVLTRGVPRDRLVAVVHNVVPHEPFPLATWLARGLLGRCGRLVCHGDDAAAALARLLGSDRRIEVTALPCLLAPAAIAAARRPRELASLTLGTRLVATVGHLRTYKRCAALAAAWSSIERPPGARLVFAGESYLRGGERDALRRAVKAEPSISVLDRYLEDEELAWILAAADAIVATPGAASQSGIPPIATALGTPVIVRGAAPDRPVAASSPPQPSAAALPVTVADDERGLAAALAARLAAPAPAPARDRLASFDAGAFSGAWRRTVEAMGIRLRP